MEIPTFIREAIREVCLKHRSSAALSCDEAIKAVRTLPEFETAREALIDHAIHEVVWSIRGELTTAVVSQAVNPPTPAKAPYTGEPKVGLLNSDAFIEHTRSVYNMMMGGKTLGDLTGAEVKAIAEVETEKARGHTQNAELARWLGDRVKDKQTVREAVPADEIAKELRSIERKLAARRRRSK